MSEKMTVERKDLLERRIVRISNEKRIATYRMARLIRVSDYFAHMNDTQLKNNLLYNHKEIIYFSNALQIALNDDDSWRTIDKIFIISESLVNDSLKEESNDLYAKKLQQFFEEALNTKEVLKVDLIEEKFKNIISSRNNILKDFSRLSKISSKFSGHKINDFKLILDKESKKVAIWSSMINKEIEESFMNNIVFVLLIECENYSSRILKNNKNNIKANRIQKLFDEIFSI